MQSESYWRCDALYLLKYARTTLFNKSTTKNNHTLYPLLPDFKIYQCSVHIMAFLSHRTEGARRLMRLQPWNSGVEAEWLTAALHALLQMVHFRESEMVLIVRTVLFPRWKLHFGDVKSSTSRQTTWLMRKQPPNYSNANKCVFDQTSVWPCHDGEEEITSGSLTVSLLKLCLCSLMWSMEDQ